MGDEGREVVEREDISPDIRDVGRIGLDDSSAEKFSYSYHFRVIRSHLRK